jgi:undecaprenyl-diphosphatase
MQLGTRIRSRIIRRWVSVAMMLFAAFMVIGRLLSGVHWFSDIVGGVLISAGLVMLYVSVRGTEFRS